MITDERRFEFEGAIRRAVPRDLLVEIKERFPLAAKQADDAVRQSHKAIADGVPLSRVRESKAVGLVRHQLLDEVFEQALLRHGGECVKSVEVEVNPDQFKSAPLHLTTGVFGGTLVGFASHRELAETPIKNATRKALCHQNRGLTPDFFHGPEMFNDRQRFVLIMVRRDPVVLGKIASMTISISDSRAEQFIYQASIEDFLAGYGEASSSTVVGKRPTRLRAVSGTFKEGKVDKESAKDK